MSNIEEDIKRCEKLIEPQNANWIGITNQLAIAHLIEKVKELRAMCEEYCPKTERIKELEEENRIFALEGSRVKLKLHIEKNYIPKQKVKDKIKEIKEDKESKYFATFLMARDINYAIDILEELLEDK